MGNFRGPRRARLATFALAAAALPLVAVAKLNDVCVNVSGFDTKQWVEGTIEDMAARKVDPHIQCWRDPPCIRWTWLTTERCKEWPSDDDWPTASPMLPAYRPGIRRIKEVINDFLVGKTLTVVGDSINHNLYESARCEAARAGFEINSEGSTGLNEKERALKELLKQHRANKAFSGDAPRDPIGVYNPNKTHVDEGTLIVEYGAAKYKPKDLDLILEFSDVVIVNYGLHYEGASLEEYEADMARLVPHLEGWMKENPGKVALFRESSAQHFPGSGSYTWQGAHPESVDLCHCSKMEGDVARNNKVFKWNAYMRKLLHNHPRIGLTPFYDLTALMPNMHEEIVCALEAKHRTCCDCTHFWAHYYDAVYDLLRTHTAHPHHHSHLVTGEAPHASAHDVVVA